MKKLLLVFSVLLGLVSCETPFQYTQGDCFHTIYRIQYRHTQPLEAGIDSCLRAVDASLSMFNPRSTLSRINQSEAGWVDISADTMAGFLIERALEISRLTDGAFDLTVAPLVNFWGFGTEGRSTKTDTARLAEIRAYVGYDKLSYETGRVGKSDRRMRLDASAIAKGYACDVVGRYLESQGIRDYLVEIGGEIRLSGLNRDKKIWSVGVDRPVDDPQHNTHRLQSALRVSDKGIATSGNYRNYYQQGERRIAHTIDPKSGQPALHGLLSATVIADDCLTADALATAFMVMGKEKAVRLLDSLPEVWAYLLYQEEDGRIAVWQSPSLDDKVEAFER